MTNLLGYDYSVVYKSKSKNVVADALSRRFEQTFLALSAPTYDFIQELKNEYENFPVFKQKIEDIKASKFF